MALLSTIIAFVWLFVSIHCYNLVPHSTYSQVEKFHKISLLETIFTLPHCSFTCVLQKRWICLSQKRWISVSHDKATRLKFQSIFVRMESNQGYSPWNLCFRPIDSSSLAMISCVFVMLQNRWIYSFINKIWSNSGKIISVESLDSCRFYSPRLISCWDLKKPWFDQLVEFERALVRSVVGILNRRIILLYVKFSYIQFNLFNCLKIWTYLFYWDDEC